MAEGTRNGVMAPTPDERAVGELAASRRELVASVTGLIDSYVKHAGETPATASERARQALPFDPATQEADQVGWWELANLIEQDAERGQALWQRLKDEARGELASGIRASRSLKRPVTSRPYERAQFVAVVEGLRQALGPRDPLEELLLQQMASAYDLHLRWQTVAVQRLETEAWQGERDKRRALENMSPRERERYQENHGWLPPRLAETDALEQAAMMADRYQRSFLRLMKAFRDNRRLFGSLIVAGGQVNIADGPQQVNVAVPAAGTTAGPSTAPEDGREEDFT